MAWDISTDIFEKFDEALEAFRDRVPMPKADFEKLTAEAKQKAFTVANIAQMDMVQQVLDSIDRAIEQGTDLKAWKEEIGPALIAAWGSQVATPGHRLDTIFVNNIHTAFSHGRVRQMQSPEVARLRPYGLYDTVRDGRRTDICKKRHGVLLPTDNDWWGSNTPPLHHRCRSQRRWLRKAQARRRGGVQQMPGDAPDAQSGFGKAPAKTHQVAQVKPDWSKYDPQIAAVGQEKLAASG